MICMKYNEDGFRIEKRSLNKRHDCTGMYLYMEWSGALK